MCIHRFRVYAYGTRRAVHPVEQASPYPATEDYGGLCCFGRLDVSRTSMADTFFMQRMGR